MRTAPPSCPRPVAGKPPEVKAGKQLITSPAAGNLAYLAAPKTPQSECTASAIAATIGVLAARLSELPAAEPEVEDRTDV